MVVSLQHQDDPGIGAMQLLETIVAKMGLNRNVSINQYGEIKTKIEKFPLYRIETIDLQELESPVMVTLTGFHGDEIAGPLTVMKYIDYMFNLAEANGISLVCYPLVNPSGFNLRTRYNHLKQVSNNDFLRYKLHDGQWVDDMGASMDFKEWVWSDDYGVIVPETKKLPIETIALIKDLKKLPYARIKAVLDIHQDLFFESYKGQFSYSYCLGEIDLLREIAKKTKHFVPLLKNTPIEEGFGISTTEVGVNISQHVTEVSPKTDDYGVVIRYDGSCTDAFHRLGVPYNVALETTAAVPLERCDELHLFWIRELVNLITRK